MNTEKTGTEEKKVPETGTLEEKSPKMTKRIVKHLISAALMIGVLIAVMLEVLTLTEYLPEEREEAVINIRNGLNFARKVLATGECNLLILDEVLEVVNKNIISVDDLRSLVDTRMDTDIIITGSEMNVEVCKFADKISEIGNMQFRNF